MMRVLFVDDEPNILDGLRRSLRPLRNEWDTEFLTSAETALAYLAENGCDVIVSDMKMPGMDGADFLQKVRERHPECIRIALSGETDNHLIYRCVQNAHQYIAKPCDAAVLAATVRRATVLRKLMTDASLKTLVSRLSTLPSMPKQYQQVMQELQSDDPSLQEIGEIIESDAAMTAKILQLVNSAFFGLVRQVSSPSEAANYLGLDVIRTLVLSTGIFSQFDGEKAHGAMLHKIWNDSMRVATLARSIAARYCQEPLAEDYAYMGGMLASIGKLVFLENLPESYATIERRHATEAAGYEYIERNVIGHTHTEVGAYLASLWGLPNPVVECVAFYAHPANSIATDVTSLAAVHIAHAIVHGNGEDKLDLLDYGFVRKHGLIENLPQMTALYKNNDNLSESNHD